MSGAIPVTVPLPAGAPGIHRFQSRAGSHVLVVPFTRIYDLVGADGEDTIIAAALGDPVDNEVPLDRIDEPAPQSISLNVSSSCNLSCGYCYAAQGGFGGAQPKPMGWETAQAAIDRLLAGATRAAPVTIGFLGGEPFANRALIHTAVAYAAAEGDRLKHDVRFSVTTNGTLLRADDIEMLRRHPFAVTVSLDGDSALQNEQRPRARGTSGSWADVVEHVGPLLASPGSAKLAARATVTRRNIDIMGRVEAIAALGFPEIGVAPLRVSAAPDLALGDADWNDYLGSLIAAANVELNRLRSGLPIRLTNFAVALKQLHRGASSPYPCGAGGGYFSVGAEGRWYACHRAIGDERFDLGSNAGLDHGRRRDFLLARHVHAQTDCHTCWARYLCSGACHQEAAARTPASCDFIRGWLDFCLTSYCELLTDPASMSPAAYSTEGAQP